MCANCDMSSPEWGDFGERFIFEDDSLDYYDGPIGGWVRCIQCKERYKFECFPIIVEMLWHWVLQPVKSAADENMPLSKMETDKQAMKWISVIEDRRSSATSKCFGAWIQNKRPPAYKD